MHGTAVGIFAGLGGTPGEGSAGADVAGIESAAGGGDGVVSVVAVGPDDGIACAEGDLGGGEGTAANGNDDGRPGALGGASGRRGHAKSGGGEGEEDK